MQVIIVATLVLLLFLIVDSVKRLPIGQSLYSTQGFRLLSHAAHQLWWVVTIYYKGWGFEIFLTPAPYWSPTTGNARSVGVRLFRCSLLVYLGLLHREVTMRTPPRSWIDVRI